MDTIGINLVNKMRIILTVILFQRILFAQDSLFWFDMSKVRDPIPPTPKVLDKVFGTSQLNVIDSIKNARVSTQEGFRLQIYESSAAEQANKIFKKYEKTLSDSLYIIFEVPLYKIHYGNFITKSEAEVAKNALKKKGYKNIWIVKSRIEQNIFLGDKYNK